MRRNDRDRHCGDHQAMLAKCKTVLARSLDRLLAARRRRDEHDRAFYRDLKNYCRANNLSSICEDDWKTAAPDDVNERTLHAKGKVS